MIKQMFTVAVHKLKFMILLFFAIFPNTQRDYCIDFSDRLLGYRVKIYHCF